VGNDDFGYFAALDHNILALVVQAFANVLQLQRLHINVNI
jgi:hypothetical protein